MGIRDFNSSTIEKLWDNTIVLDGCWLYQGNINRYGYGRLFLANGTKEELVHRVSANIFLGYDLYNGFEQINHKLECKNKHCWCPDHLYLGTHAENVIDTVKLKTHKESRKTHCKHGHEFCISNTSIVKRFRNGKVVVERVCIICRNLTARKVHARRVVKNG